MKRMNLLLLVSLIICRSLNAEIFVGLKSGLVLNTDKQNSPSVIIGSQMGRFSLSFGNDYSYEYSHYTSEISGRDEVTEKSIVTPSIGVKYILVQKPISLFLSACYMKQILLNIRSDFYKKQSQVSWDHFVEWEKDNNDDVIYLLTAGLEAEVTKHIHLSAEYGLQQQIHDYDLGVDYKTRSENRYLKTIGLIGVYYTLGK